MKNTVIDTDYALLNALNVILSNDKTQYGNNLITKGYDKAFCYEYDLAIDIFQNSMIISALDGISGF